MNSTASACVSSKPLPISTRTGSIEIADRFWPYHKQLCETPVSDQTRYTERVRRLFLSRACVQGTFGAADEKLAVELYRRHVPLEQIERAYLLGCARKYVALLNRPGAALISSLHYLRSSVLCPPGSGRGLTCFGTAAVGRRHGLIIVLR